MSLKQCANGEHGSDFSSLLEALVAQSPDNHPPLERTPCSNADYSIRWRCKNGGKLVCGRCQLVRYCSKVSRLGTIASTSSSWI